MGAQRPGQRPAPPAWKIPLVSAVFGVILAVVGLALANSQFVSFGLVWLVVHLISAAVFYAMNRLKR